MRQPVKRGTSPLHECASGTDKVFSMQTTVGTEAAPLTGGTVSVYYDQARGETTLVGRLFGDAKRQIVMEIQNHVRDGRGVILIDWPQAKHVMAAATKRLGLGEFRHVQTVIG